MNANSRTIVSNRELIYAIAFFLMSLSTMLEKTYYAEVLPSIFLQILRYASIILFAFLVFSLRLKQRTLFFLIGMVGFVLFLVIYLNSPRILLFILAILASYKVPIDKVLKIYLFSNFVPLLFVILSSVIGIIPNDISIVHDGNKAYSLGFVYYSLSSYYVFFGIITLLYTRSIKKCQKYNWIVFALATLVLLAFNEITDVRLVSILSIPFIIAVAVFDKKGVIKIKDNFFSNCIAILSFPIGLFLTLYLSFNVYKQSWITALNIFLNYRWSFNKMALDKYTINLFGNNVEMNTASETYFFIDSGYLYNLLRYGLLLFLIVLIFNILVFRFSVKSQNNVLFFWCLISAVFNIMNDALFDPTLNPIMLFIPHALVYFSLSAQRKKKSIKFIFGH